jgi:hypothetical protein
MTKTNTANANFSMYLFLLFLGLKLAEIIDWSWWWVTAPLWIPAMIVLGIAIIFLIGSTFFKLAIKVKRF